MIIKPKSSSWSVRNVELKDLEKGDIVLVSWGLSYDKGKVIAINKNRVLVKLYWGQIVEIDKGYHDWFFLRKKRKSLFDLIFKK